MKWNSPQRRPCGVETRRGWRAGRSCLLRTDGLGTQLRPDDLSSAHDRQAAAVTEVVARNTPLVEFVAGLNPLGKLSFTLLQLFAKWGRQVLERAEPVLEVGAEGGRTDQVSFLDRRMRQARLPCRQRASDLSMRGHAQSGRSSLRAAACCNEPPGELAA